jgi:general L-amino acid transport system permease protein
MASDQSYIRTQMIPASPPPSGTGGIVKWAREKLFSGPLNTLLTVLALVALYQLLTAVLPWMLNSNWTAASRKECLEVSTGACFAVISERWTQMLFGFYPADAYWRPILAFVLLAIALAPVLVLSFPRKGLWFSAIYPGLMVWLLWGGSLWAMVLVYAGFALAWGIYIYGERHLNSTLVLLVSVAAAVFWWLIMAGPIAEFLQKIIPLGLKPVESRNFGGFMLSFVIGITGIVLSLPLGILLALGRRSDMLFVKSVCVGFIEFIRGVPLITLLLVASTLLNIFMPPGTNFDIILRVIIMVTLFSAAYMAETIRGGLAAIPRGQFEAADALGLDYWQAQRLIVMPQALKISIPGIVNNFIGLFKDTTLVSIIGLLDPLGFAKAIRADANWNGIVWELYGFIAFVFFICCFSMSRYSQYLERKLRTTH